MFTDLPTRAAVQAHYTALEARLRHAHRETLRDTGILRDLGVALLHLGRNDDAEAVHRRALALEPDTAVNHVALGTTMLRQGRNEDAERCLARAGELCPGMVEARLGMAELAMRRGQMREAFTLFESCIIDTAWTRDGYPLSSGHIRSRWWDGRPLDGSTREAPSRRRILYVRAAGGYGDYIWLAARYIPIIRAQGTRVVLECWPALERLFRENDVADEYVPIGTYRPDTTTTVMNLPHAMGTDLDTIPWSGPYLRAPALPDDLRAALSVGDDLRVGLVWRGNPNNLSEPWRSMDLSTVAPLAQIPGVRLYSLQVGDGAEQAKHPPEGMSLDGRDSGSTLVHLGNQLTDWATTAAVMAELDLIVSVDTGAAHLAGALGRPVWVLLPRVAEWRWIEGRDDSPWYPNVMRLYRQENLGDWMPVVERVADHLRRLAAERIA